MSEIKLLPCPFCGGEATTYQSKSGFGTMCKNIPFCCIFEAAHKTEEEAINRWNTRKPMERIVERLEEVAKDYADSSDEYGQGKHFSYSNAAEIVKKEGGL